MAKILFYEKPGCANNRRQKDLLLAAGHELEVRNLLATPWRKGELRAFFGDLPVDRWFNRAAPRIKSGEIVPETLDGEAALALMLEDPLLIRRPLMQCGERRTAGFEPEHLRDWLGPPEPAAEPADLERCRRKDPCPSP